MARIIKNNKLFIILFILYISIIFIIGYSHPLLLDEGLYSNFSKMLANGNYQELLVEMPQIMGNPPLNIVINSFFIKIFGYSEFVLRLLTLICAILIFPVSYFLAREFGLEKKNSVFFAFLLSLAFPIQEMSHFAMTDVPAVLFMELSLLFFLKYPKSKHNLILGALFCMIGFFFKQYVVATAILIPYFFYKDKFKINSYYVISLIILILPIFDWMMFNSLYYGSNRLVSSYIQLQFDPFIMLKKIGWMIYVMGFYLIPFIPYFIIKKFSSKSKLKYLVLLLIPLSFISFEYLGSELVKGGYSIRGRIPLLYHVLPHTIYLILAILFFLSFLLFLTKINFKNQKSFQVILVIISFLLIMSVKYFTTKGITIADIRHTIFFLPLIYLLAFNFVKRNWYFYLMSIGIILYSLIWILSLIASANSAYEVAQYLNNNINGTYYAEPILHYATKPSVTNISQAQYIVFGEGFSYSYPLENCTIIKNFDSKLLGFTIAKRFICKR